MICVRTAKRPLRGRSSQSGPRDWESLRMEVEGADLEGGRGMGLVVTITPEVAEQLEEERRRRS